MINRPEQVAKALAHVANRLERKKFDTQTQQALELIMEEMDKLLKGHTEILKLATEREELIQILVKRMRKKGHVSLPEYLTIRRTMEIGKNDRS